MTLDAMMYSIKPIFPERNQSMSRLAAMDIIPFHAFRKCHTATTEDIERTPDSEIDLPVAARLDTVKICKASSASSISHRNRAPLRQSRNQLLVNALLEAFNISSMDQKLRAVWLEHFDGF